MPNNAETGRIRAPVGLGLNLEEEGAFALTQIRLAQRFHPWQVFAGFGRYRKDFKNLPNLRF